MTRAGFAQCKITPQAGLLMGGYRLRRGGASGVHDDLYATCAVIGDSQTEVALISLDLLCLPHTVVDHIKGQIFARANIAPENMVVACTHTHAGPGTLGLSGESEANDEYLASLPEFVSALVTTAQQRVCNTNISILQVNVPNVAFNRRIKLKDGSSVINIDRINTQDVQAVGITDPCATVLFFEADSTTLGVIVNFTLHPTVLGEKNYLFSRDYPGYLVDDLRAHLPGQPVGLFFNGAFGNINQIKVPGEWITTFQEAQRIGEVIARQILENQSCRTALKSSVLAAATKRFYIPRRAEASKQHSDPLHTAGPRGAEIEERPKGTHLSPEKENLLHREAQRLTGATRDLVELQVFQIGEVEIVVLPGEIFVELGLEIKKQSGSPYPLVFGNANGYIGYVPTESAFDDGGYETRLSLTSRLVPEAGGILLKNIDQMRNKK